jgi:hypothetical protein
VRVIVPVDVIVEVVEGLDVRLADRVARAVLEAEPEAEAVKEAVAEGEAVGVGANTQQKESSVSYRGPIEQPSPNPRKLQSPAPLTISEPSNTTSQIDPAWT